MSTPLYRAVNPHVSWPEMEADILTFWAEHHIFQRSLEEKEGCPEWVFYEGPPTANGKPGIHHVEARTFKDIFCRFQTMRGKYVYRKAGWDCHGLPVEVEVEKQLGIHHKREIEEKIGIEEFVRLCRESVKRYVDDWERLTSRIGFWIDMRDAYWTMSPEYVESVWWILKQIWDKGLLEEDFKVVPYCPRCETSLSSHEQHMTGAYQQVTDPSVYVRFPLVGEAAPPGLQDAALLVWTTTPWTLLSNMAAAVGEDIIYAQVADPGRPGGSLVLAKERVEPLLGEDARIEKEMRGADIVGLSYVPPFGFVPTKGQAHTVRPGDFVTTEDGTGIVHIAPYGEDDIVVARRDDLPIVQMIDGTGHVASSGERFAGLWFKDADAPVVADLERRGLLFKAEDYEHAYPHCWRCGTPLLYFARKDWYIRTSQIREDLQVSNEETNWQPPTIKYGRFGDWLANNVDWSLSRDRYWGTPLPVWKCRQNHTVCVGSFAELEELTGRPLNGFDPHRPFVDEITFPCTQCGEPARRVSSVIDAWFDSGSMPFGQWHYPFENEDVFETRFPADFISEAIDQTRGWFYSLLAVATLIRGQNSYRNVVCLGHIVDADGRKMSKSLGNAFDPWAVLDVHGADATRWYLLTGGTPWAPRRVSMELFEESLRKYLLTLWNTYSFWVTYASIESFDPTEHDIPASERPEIDRWVLAELDDAIRVVTDSLENFDTTTGGRRLDRFVDDLSNWYVRRSRRRFWRSSAEAETRAAFLTLWECLVTVARLTAPFTPFVAEEIFTNLASPGAGRRESTGRGSHRSVSVHLDSWPAADATRSDDALRRRMALVRRLVALGRAARTEAKVRVRQPLARALMVLPAVEAQDLRGLERLLAEELNVKDIEVAQGMDELISYSVKPNFKSVGPRFGARVKALTEALARVDAGALVAALDRGEPAVVSVEGEQVELARDDLDIRVAGREGFALAREGSYGVALDLEIDERLASEGIAREVVRAVQELRKSSGLAVEDRIELWLSPTDEKIARALADHRAFIAGEVLASELELGGEPAPDAHRGAVELEEGSAAIALRRRV